MGSRRLLIRCVHFLQEVSITKWRFQCDSAITEKKVFKRFVSNRWLSVGRVCERIIVNWKCLDKYFLKSEHTASIKDSSIYKRIAARMHGGNIMLAWLQSVLSVANLFSPFLSEFQSQCTSIHLLFEELAQILQLLLQRFVKSVTEGQEWCSAAVRSAWQLPAEACGFGTQTSGILKKLKADKNPRLALLHKDDTVPETFQQISLRKIAFAEQVPVQRSVSEAFHEKQSRQHSDDETTGCIGSSRGARDEFSRFSVYRMEIVSSRCWYTTGMSSITKRPCCISWWVLVTGSYTEGWSPK